MKQIVKIKIVTTTNLFKKWTKWEVKYKNVCRRSRDMVVYKQTHTHEEAKTDILLVYRITIIYWNIYFNLKCIELMENSNNILVEYWKGYFSQKKDTF